MVSRALWLQVYYVVQVEIMKFYLLWTILRNIGDVNLCTSDADALYTRTIEQTILARAGQQVLTLK